MVMKLSEYIQDAGLGPKAFGKKVGVSRQTIHLWMAGKAMPSVKMIRNIEQATDGKVGFNDFVS